MDGRCPALSVCGVWGWKGAFTLIDLAPGHKYGLSLTNPVMLAAGAIGYGEATPPGVDLAALGAVVVGPFMRNSRGGEPPPRLAETNGGFVLNSGLQNRGVKAACKRFARLWPSLGCPVIAQIADSIPRMAGRVAEQLATEPGLSGLELLIPRHSTPDVVRELVRHASQSYDLPVMAKLPLEVAAGLAPAAVEAGATALVVGQPPLGAGYAADGAGQPLLINGDVYGPLAFAAMCAALETVHRLDLGCPLIACGGLHTAEQARQALRAGASAIQIDSAFWVEPGLPGYLVQVLPTEMAATDR